MIGAGAGAGSLINGYVSKTNGGDFTAGYIGGAIFGALVSGAIGGILSVVSGEDFWSGVANGAADGFALGAISGAISSGVQVANAVKAWAGTSKYSPYEDLMRHYYKHVIGEQQKAIAKNIVNYTRHAKKVWRSSSNLGRIVSSGSIKIKLASDWGGFYTKAGKILSFFYI